MFGSMIDIREESVMADSSKWDAIWNEQMALASRKWEDEHFWYERTQLPPIGFQTSNYADILIEKLALAPEDSVLDIGCGDGAISLRIAKKVKWVTALDSNPNLLFPITQRAASEGITNLKFLNLDWLEARIGPDIPMHDIVLASRFRQITNLGKFLEQMHTAARDRCYLTWIVTRKELDSHICEILGKEYHPLPDYSIIPRMLESMGISASVDIFEAAGTHRFETVEAAIEDATRGYIIESEQSSEQIISLVQNELKEEAGYTWRDTSTAWALIRWRKNLNP